MRPYRTDWMTWAGMLSIVGGCVALSEDAGGLGWGAIALGVLLLLSGITATWWNDD
jgi:uncharacterized membrane protein HdeD (DUF308 family)